MFTKGLFKIAHTHTQPTKGNKKELRQPLQIMVKIAQKQRKVLLDNAIFKKHIIKLYNSCSYRYNKMRKAAPPKIKKEL